jgi:Disulphide bond corrector protein DsbC
MKSRLLTFTGIVALLACGALLAQNDASTQNRGYVEFEPLDTVTLSSGHTTPVQFTFHVKSGYHINSSKPLTEELIPTSIGFTPPPDLVIAKVQYPAGQLTSFPFDPSQKLSVYSGDVIIKAAIIPQPNAASGTYTVHGEFKYQACDNNACYPPKKLPVQFNVKLAKAGGTHARPNKQSPHVH